jgi:hypothetical protein
MDGHLCVQLCMHAKRNAFKLQVLLYLQPCKYVKRQCVSFAS